MLFNILSEVFMFLRLICIRYVRERNGVE